MAITVFTNAFLIDCTGKDPVEGAAVVVEGERIKDVIPSGKVGPLPGKVDTVDLKGRTLMPGLTDAHVHVCAVEGNIPEQHRHNPPSLIAAKALRRMEQCLMQGFTTVRDAGGADYGFREAAESGLYPGPRMLVSGRPLSQTGGHADKRRRSEWIEPVDCCVGMAGMIADGADEVRKAARENLRHDVDQIKIMASGGAMSPGDELDTTQYTVDEMRAAVEEARAVGKYVLAHAYSGSAIRNAVQAGVRCIEHGNLLDEAGAQAIKAAGAYLVPTMVTYEAISREGKNYGIGDHQIQKINLALEKSLEGLTHAYRAGLQDRLGLGPARRHAGPARDGVRAEGPGDEADGGAPLRHHGQRGDLPDDGSHRLRRARQVRRPDRGGRRSAQEPARLPEHRAHPRHREGRRVRQARALARDGEEPHAERSRLREAGRLLPGAVLRLAAEEGAGRADPLRLEGSGHPCGLRGHDRQRQDRPLPGAARGSGHRRHPGHPHRSQG